MFGCCSALTATLQTVLYIGAIGARCKQLRVLYALSQVFVTDDLTAGSAGDGAAAVEVDGPHGIAVYDMDGADDDELSFRCVLRGLS
jgi:hypothetical protein